MWKEFFDWEINSFHPLHWYLAQIAREIVVSRNPRKLRHLKTKDFILKFTFSKEKEPTSNAQQIEQKTQRSKAFWGAFVSNAKPVPISKMPKGPKK